MERPSQAGFQPRPRGLAHASVSRSSRQAPRGQCPKPAAAEQPLSSQAVAGHGLLPPALLAPLGVLPCAGAPHHRRACHAPQASYGTEQGTKVSVKSTSEAVHLTLAYAAASHIVDAYLEWKVTARPPPLRAAALCTLSACDPQRSATVACRQGRSAMQPAHSHCIAVQQLPRGHL